MFDFNVKKAVSFTMLLLLLSVPSFGREMTFLPVYDNLLYYASADESTGDTVYPASYNGVGKSRDYSMNEFWVYESIFWFDLSSINGKKIKSARLILSPAVLAGDPEDAYNNTYYEIRVVAELWDPRTVTINNAPAYYTGYYVPFNVPTSTVPVSLNVTDAVKYWADGTYPNYGFRLRDGGTYLPDRSFVWSTMFGSQEKKGTVPPELVVTIEDGGGSVVSTVIVPLLLLQ
ncbi:DNRLRE domain-containing protein [Sulfurovum sp.]|uniref:DNRLRE domain-containing protein n=1 Tax=Sulfurovum sp. TaxID=1969726 RepID=UPI0025FD816A|nr:DNRLRE domain-containing protein [Sulfurovum sp.]